MLVLNEQEVTSLLPVADVLSALEGAFAAQAQGKINMPLRTLASAGSGILGAMPAAVSSGSGSLGAKLVTFFPGNAALGKHTHQAVILLFAVKTGEPLALMDGRYITEVRTAAVSALATRALARSDAHILALLGTGVQARAHVDALREVMTIASVRIWGRDAARAASLAAFARERGLAATAFATTAEACSGADVVCTVTSSHEPIVRASDINPGTHVNAVGFAGPNARELPGALMSGARIVVDSLDGALYESGNILAAIREGSLDAPPELTLLCDVLAGSAPGRRDSKEVTIFDSLGIAIEDVACAAFVYERAIAAGCGKVVPLS